ncbi:MAG: hypothetical protein GWO24_33005, partial [Akkermansiaceae bacterium]|nr:hypothetical protein [Akkermansiaceae bacterium]
VRNLPEGRVLPDQFALKLGNVVTHHVAYSYSISDHVATGTVRFLSTPPEEGEQPISVSLDAGTTWIPMGTVLVPPRGPSIVPGSLILSRTYGGTTATLGINGTISKEKLIPF